MAPARDIDLDTLADGPLEVRLLRDFRVGEAPIRAPHRHDYHELIWVRGGAGVHRVDGDEEPVRPGAVTVIGRGRVHQFVTATGLDGAIVRFRDEVVAGGAERVAAGWLLSGQGARAIDVPPGDAPRLDGALATLHAELRRPPDTYTADVSAHLIAAILLWLERWYDGARAERHEQADADLALHRRFARLLEDDFAAHHDAGHYADALAVPRAALARVLVERTGRTTKDLILDRVMVEARRLLRFTDLTVGEIAFRVGFADQLYFSRAFKREAGVPPVAYRAAARGTG